MLQPLVYIFCIIVPFCLAEHQCTIIDLYFHYFSIPPGLHADIPSDTPSDVEVLPLHQPTVLTNTSTKATSQTNFAAEEFGAKILSFAPDKTKGAKNILSTNRDKYLLVPCSSQLVVDVELSEEIFITNVAISSFEFYSGAPSTIRILTTRQPLSDKTSTPFSLEDSIKAGWVDFGVFNISTRHGSDSVDIPYPCWGKVIRIVVLDWSVNRHHLCTVSYLKVSGSTPLEHFKVELAESLEQSKTSSSAVAFLNASLHQVINREATFTAKLNQLEATVIAQRQHLELVLEQVNELKVLVNGLNTSSPWSGFGVGVSFVSVAIVFVFVASLCFVVLLSLVCPKSFDISRSPTPSPVHPTRIIEQKVLHRRSKSR
ncbi:hypothetical protein P9112_013009 [Eukaryota sp. TZLM1-RC]